MKNKIFVFALACLVATLLYSQNVTMTGGGGSTTPDASLGIGVTNGLASITYVNGATNTAVVTATNLAIGDIVARNYVPYSVTNGGTVGQYLTLTNAGNGVTWSTAAAAAAGGDVYLGTNNTFNVSTTNIMAGATILGGQSTDKITIPGSGYGGYSWNNPANISLAQTNQTGRINIIHSFFHRNNTENPDCGDMIYIGSTNTPNGSISIGEARPGMGVFGATSARTPQIRYYSNNNRSFSMIELPSGNSFFGYFYNGSSATAGVGTYVNGAGTRTLWIGNAETSGTISNRCSIFAVSGNTFLAGALTVKSGTAVSNILTVTATTNFGVIAANSRVDVSLALTGAKPSDAVALRLPDGIPQGLDFSNTCTTNDVLIIRCDNNTAGVITNSANMLYGATVISY